MNVHGVGEGNGVGVSVAIGAGDGKAAGDGDGIVDGAATGGADTPVAHNVWSDATAAESGGSLNGRE